MKEARRRLFCFLVMYNRGHYQVAGGERATVHAPSMAWAKKLLRESKRWLRGMSLQENKECDPDKLTPGQHCARHLIASVEKNTPLGSIAPNSPEWHERFHSPVRGKISEQRMKEIEKVHERQPDI